MLEELFPKVHDRYRSLPILGPTLGEFAGWLTERGYRVERTRQHLRTARQIDRELWKRGFRALSEVTQDALRACAPPPRRSKDNPYLASTARCLERFLEERTILVVPVQPPTRTEQLLGEYRSSLEDVRGFARATVLNHLRTASALLEHIGYAARPSHLAALTPSEIEAFVRIVGARLSRASLQHDVAHLRSFLRFLATRGETPSGLDAQIDTPRVYQGERLPQALPLETVRAFLDSIDRSTPMGVRDYAIFLLIATYGLRAGEIVALTLDDVEWRAGRIRVAQRKTATPLLLPLTDAVGKALLDYLRRGRPALPYREIFLRCRAPAGALKPTAVTEAFHGWSRRSGLAIPIQGPHCLRHSYAVRLLRQGVSLKTIGDVLGHRSAESTCVYLRLAIDDLRSAALPLPCESISCAAGEMRS
jgi:site-specific recombinase XerD